MTEPLIVIPCLNEERHLFKLLGTLLAENPLATVVVADGGSTDASRSIVNGLAAHYPRLHLLDNPARIQSAGINAAVSRFSTGRGWLVRIDAHCGYPRNYVAQLIDAAIRSGAECVVVPMVTVAQGCFQQAAATAQNSVLGNGGSAHRSRAKGCFVDHGHHALMDIAKFVQAGGYDETFSHNEDAELDLRLAGAGAQIWLEPSLALSYWPRRSPGALFRQYRGYGRGRAMTLARHKVRIKVRQAVPVAIGPIVALALAAICLAPAYPPALILALPALLWAALSLGYGAILGIRTRSLCAAASGVAAMTMHFAWSVGFVGQMVLGPRPGNPPPALLPRTRLGGGGVA
ncbi:glycosyl transferase family protein [Novosphingobium sp. Rr 2-17]|uniref:glycosyltransferase family 2 protein n=1 Tax=Novosphingobium sp. Rr 2-17 TaxID=555793 RepID=UPI000269A86C|nr:glycosyltransferase family 2 protein [Novosphingobium sp. Rr 2-17]EIZ77904.1 glycosyl transferase family protein [Novosphingobium sp. Rr 2-17]